MVPQVELFSFFFWENWRHQKDILKLTDLYYLMQMGSYLNRYLNIGWMGIYWIIVIHVCLFLLLGKTVTPQSFPMKTKQIHLIFHNPLDHGLNTVYAA